MSIGAVTEPMSKLELVALQHYAEAHKGSDGVERTAETYLRLLATIAARDAALANEREWVRALTEDNGKLIAAKDDACTEHRRTDAARVTQLEEALRDLMEYTPGHPQYHSDGCPAARCEDDHDDTHHVETCPDCQCSIGGFARARAVLEAK